MSLVTVVLVLLTGLSIQQQIKISKLQKEIEKTQEAVISISRITADALSSHSDGIELNKKALHLMGDHIIKIDSVVNRE
jgi:hypothetical protein